MNPAALAKLELSHPGIGAALMVEHPILKDMASKLDRFGSLSPKQVAFAFRLAAEAALPKVPVVEGRHEVTGKVVSLKEVTSEYGGYYDRSGFYVGAKTTLKMTVATDAGYKVYGSVPSALAETIKKGDTVTFTATFEKSKDDPSFGFFKRPSGASVTETAEKEAA